MEGNMKITENVVMLEVGGNYGTIYPTLVWDESRIVLIDAGFPDQIASLTDAIVEAGVQVKDITDIILTHQDMDHIGCVPDILSLSPSARIWAHEEEAPYLDGRETPIKLATLLQNYDGLPDEGKAWCDQLQAGYVNRRLQKIQTLTDGEVLPAFGGIEVVHTPGHTPGHICLFLQKSKVMVCGDAANITDGKLTGANPQHTYDMELAAQSFAKIAVYDVRGAITYHGGYWENEMKARHKQHD